MILYATGLGPVGPAVPTGALPAGTSSALSPVTVRIGGIEMIPDFAGLSGCCAGLNQINARVPAGVSRGDAVPVVLNSGKSSNTATITRAIEQRFQTDHVWTIRDLINRGW